MWADSATSRPLSVGARPKPNRLRQRREVADAVEVATEVAPRAAELAREIATVPVHAALDLIPAPADLSLDSRARPLDAALEPVARGVPATLELPQRRGNATLELLDLALRGRGARVRLHRLDNLVTRGESRAAR